MNCDFIPVSYHHAKRIRFMLRRRVVGLVVLLAVMGFWYYSNASRIARADAMMQDAEAQQREVATVAAYKLQLLQQRSGLNDMQRMLQTLSGDRNLVYILSDLSQRVPDAIVLTKCEVDIPSLHRYAVETDPQQPVKGVPLNKKLLLQSHGLLGEDEAAKMLLHGVGANTAEIIDFAAELEQSSLFYKVNPDVLDNVVFEGRPGKTFRLTCLLARHRGGQS